VTVTRLHPLTPPSPDVSNADRITAALQRAMDDHLLDCRANQPAEGIAIVFLRNDDGGFGESWIIQGMSALEAVGLMHMTAGDLAEYGLGDACPDYEPPEVLA
jgi:hypothetical protein